MDQIKLNKQKRGGGTKFAEILVSRMHARELSLTVGNDWLKLKNTRHQTPSLAPVPMSLTKVIIIIIIKDRKKKNLG